MTDKLEALALLEDLATRADWEGIDISPEGRRGYSIEARRMAFHYAYPHMMSVLLTWRGALLFGARDLRRSLGIDVSTGDSP